MYKFLILLIFNITCFSCFAVISNDLAIVITPIADALSCLQDVSLNASRKKIYKQLPIASEVGKCDYSRLHQLLFNELVQIVEIFEHEVRCKLINVFYQINGKAHRDIWILKKNIIFISDLKKKNINLRAIPEPYTDNRHASLFNVLTLVWPWEDSLTCQKFSAGTRFVRVKKFDTAENYAIYILDTKKLQTKISFVPKSIALVKYPETKQKAIALFLEILKKWIAQKEFIPYVGGGCSFIDTCIENNFELKNGEQFGATISYWQRKFFPTRQFSGIECSSLVFRVAQIVGMPYFYKNTATLVSCLNCLEKNEHLEPGDLIWYPGHVLIVSDIKKNKLIEAVGYKLGFGKMHEIALDKVFSDVRTFSDLIKAYHERKKIYRLNIMGDRARTVKKFELLKLSSIWK
jgi:hypothetical protein